MRIGFVALLHCCQNLIPAELRRTLQGTAGPFPGHGDPGAPPTAQFCPGLQSHFKDFRLCCRIVDAAVPISMVTCYDLLDFTWKSEFPSARTTIHQLKVQILNSNLTLFLQTVSTYPTSPWKSQCFVGVRAWQKFWFGFIIGATPVSCYFTTVMW